MSRIGKLPITIPQNVKVSSADGKVNVEGPLGKLSYEHTPDVKITVEDGRIIVGLVSKQPQAKANYGTTRAHLNNLVNGVTKGYKKSLEMVGVGFNAKIQGTKIVLSVGFSHEVVMEIPQGIKCVVNKTTIDLESCDRELLGTFASKIRKVQPPEPYLGKGIKFSNEAVRRKAGKTGKK